MNTFLFIKIALIFAIIAFFVSGIFFILSFDIILFIGGFLMIILGVKTIADLKIVFEVSRLHKKGVMTRKEALNIILDSKN